MVDDLNIPTIISHLVCGHVICDLMDDHILSLTPPIFHLSLPLECIQFHEDQVIRHQLHGTSRSIIIPLLPVHFAVGLSVCFSVSFFEASSHFFNIHGDMVGMHMGNKNQLGDVGVSQTSNNAVSNLSPLIWHCYTFVAIQAGVVPITPFYPQQVCLSF